jgi:hypothetical protein
LTRRGNPVKLAYGANGPYVAAGVPHRVTRRGNRWQKVFFSDSDYECYRAMLNRSLAKRKPGPEPAAKVNQPTVL